MDRLHSWVGLMALSIVVVGTLVDKPETSTGKEKFALAASCISLIFGLFFVIANLSGSLRRLVIGNHAESAASAIVLSIWVVAIAFIQNPTNDIATTIVGEQELIIYANLYFFSWFTFLITVYLVAVNFRDNFQFGPKFSQWILLFTSSIILLATAISLRGEICDNEDADETCSRTKYAVGVGAVGITISFLAVVGSIFDKMTRLLEIGSTLLSSILYFFAVVFLTSTDGPASTMGNMYFSAWGGCIVSFILMVGTFLPLSSGDNSNEEEPDRSDNI